MGALLVQQLTQPGSKGSRALELNFEPKRSNKNMRLAIWISV
jgi:hypothetical protein